MSSKRAKIFCRDLQFKAVGCYAFAVDLLGKSRDKFPQLEDRSGQIAVVTGGARGIGLHVVTFLLKCNYKVIVGVRNTSKAEKALQDVENFYNAVLLHLDLESIKSVKSFAEAVLKRYGNVNVLVNNAGVLLVPYGLTEDGFERHFGVNYLGHFLLTHLLLPALVRGGASTENRSRVIAVTSTTYLGGKIHFDDINLDKFRCKSEAYAQSKLALIMSTSYLSELARERGWPVSFLVVDPGIVGTEVFEGTPLQIYTNAARKIIKTPEEGSRSILYACLDKRVEGTPGEFIMNCGVGQKNKLSKKKEQQNKLFVLSCKMLQMNDDQFGLENGGTLPPVVTHL